MVADAVSVVMRTLQVSELLQNLLPTPEGNKAIQELAQLVKQLLQKILPEEAEVIGYACSSFTGRQAFAVAVPEVQEEPCLSLSLSQSTAIRS